MRKIRRAIFAVCLSGLWIAPLLAQHESHEGHELVGWVPQEILERPVSLRRDIGNVHEKVTTSSSEAQAFYDQGLNYLSSYVWIEAARSFHQALRLDPKLAAAYAGLCDVYINLQDLPAARYGRVHDIEVGITPPGAPPSNPRSGHLNRSSGGRESRSHLELSRTSRTS